MIKCEPIANVFPKSRVLGNIGYVTISVLVKFIEPNSKFTLCSAEVVDELVVPLPEKDADQAQRRAYYIQFEHSMMSSFWAIEEYLKSKIPLKTFDLGFDLQFPGVDQDMVANDIFETLIQLQLEG